MLAGYAIVTIYRRMDRKAAVPGPKEEALQAVHV
jgi:hypothetical protein